MFCQILWDIIITPVAVWLVYLLWRTPGKPKIVFADCIVKERNADGKHVYKIRYMNVGYRDIFECTRIIKLIIETRDTPGSDMRKVAAYLKVGDTDVIPVIPGRSLCAGKYDYSTPDIHLGDMQTFMRPDRFSEDIRAKAAAGTLTLDDVMERYGNDKTIIEVHIFGEDGRDGRKHFPKIYKYKVGEDIKEGEFEAVDIKIGGSLKTSISTLSTLKRQE